MGVLRNVKVASRRATLYLLSGTLAIGLVPFSLLFANTAHAADPVPLKCYDSTYVVPAGEHFVSITAVGGSGQTGGKHVGEEWYEKDHGGGVGGHGAKVVARYFAVTPGETLYYGAASPSVAGGFGGASQTRGGNGGSGSFVSNVAPNASDCSIAQSALLLVAAGGAGGGGGGSGGPGGTGANAGNNGNPGDSNEASAGAGGSAGSLSTGGAGGAGGYGYNPICACQDGGTAGDSGKVGGVGYFQSPDTRVSPSITTGGHGGAGVVKKVLLLAYINSSGGGGGGGGGYYGGGGGGADASSGGGGGGGGSNFVTQSRGATVDTSIATDQDPAAVTITHVNDGSLTLSASPTVGISSKAMTFTARYTNAAATGRVTFFDDNNLEIGHSNLSGGTATQKNTYTITSPNSPIAHKVTASYAGDTGNQPASDELNFIVHAPPVIDPNPDNSNLDNKTVVYGSPASFRVGLVSNPAPTTYQWQISRDGTNYSPIAGETSNSIQYYGSVGDSGAKIRVLVSNDVGSFTTNPAKVTFTKAPIVITASSSTTAYGTPVPAVTTDHFTTYNGDGPSIIHDDGSVTVGSLGIITCSSTVPQSGAVGNYTTSCSGAANDNYTFTYKTGTAKITKTPLTITVSSDAMNYGSTVPTITPTYNGFVNNENASVLGTVTCGTTATTGSAVGNYDTTCSGATSSNYNISYVKGSLAINKVSLKITASNGSMTYGGTVPTITASYDGFVNGDSASSVGTVTCSTQATSAKDVGAYNSSCSGATNGNYTISYIKGNVSITPAPLTITASNDSMTYGGTVPIISSNVSGLVNNDKKSALVGLTCSTTATSTSPVGNNYVSSCSGVTNSNYTISYVNGTIKIKKAALTITASDGTSTYGSPAPTITASFSGFVNGEDSIKLTGTIVCSSNTSATTPAGVYANKSTCSGYTSTNYDITYVKGNITINKAVLTVTANNQTRIYGAANPTLTYGITGYVNGENSSAIGGAPSVTTAATSTTSPGQYPIVVATGSLSAANYSFTFVNGTLTITRAPITLVVKDSNLLQATIQGTMTFTGTVTNATTGKPVAGIPVTFTSKGQFNNYSISCTATSDSNGTATCTVKNVNKAFYLAPTTFTATAAPTTNYFGATANGKVVIMLTSSLNLLFGF